MKKQTKTLFNKWGNMILLMVLVFSCKTESKEIDLKPIKNFEINDFKYIQDPLYLKGDSRRYGVFPNQKINQKALKNCIFLAEKGLPITFSKGYYDTNIILKGASNINFIFNNALLTGSFQIIEKEDQPSTDINIEGKLTILDKLFIRKSTNITFDTLCVKTDTVHSLYNKKNRGVSIYAGSKRISFNRLIIDDTGGDILDFYKYTAAALQIHGWNDNPEHITVDDLVINNAARTALYLTGNNHQFNKVSIKNFGLGSTSNMFGLEDATPGEETSFAGAWVNKCNDCKIDTLEINGTLKKGLYSLKLGMGTYHQPTFINNIHFTENAKKLSIEDDELTNILVKNEY